MYRKGALLQSWERISRGPHDGMRGWVNRYARSARNLLEVSIDLQTGVDEESKGSRFLHHSVVARSDAATADR